MDKSRFSFSGEVMLAYCHYLGSPAPSKPVAMCNAGAGVKRRSSFFFSFGRNVGVLRRTMRQLIPASGRQFLTSESQPDLSLLL